jgi:hypothetical protein
VIDGQSETVKMIGDLINKIPVVIKSSLEDKKNPDAIDICLEQ